MEAELKEKEEAIEALHGSVERAEIEAITTRRETE